ncbi:uncharacterized protein Hap1MRO34_005473 [Clarias gariepinus]
MERDTHESAEEVKRTSGGDGGNEAELESYTRAKFTLWAYIICWTALRILLQKLRISMAGQQVQEALEAPNDPGGAEQTKCELDSDTSGWTEQESNSLQESCNDEDEFPALLGVEDLYPGLDLENGPEEADVCKVQGEVKGTHSSQQEIQPSNTLKAEKEEVNSYYKNRDLGEVTEVPQERLSLQINSLSAEELNQGVGELNTQHVNTFNAGLQTAKEKDDSVVKEEKKNNSSSSKGCDETYVKDSTCLQRTDLFSLKSSATHKLERTSTCSAEIHKNINRTREPESPEVGIKDTGTQGCSQDSDLHRKKSNGHCPNITDAESTTCIQQRRNINLGGELFGSKPETDKLRGSRG